jgi:phage tail-like protein
MSPPQDLSALAATVPDAPRAISSNGHGPMPLGFTDGKTPEPSSYLRLLPAIYAADEFAGRFLRIFEDVFDPISVMVDNLPYYFDPMTAPVELLDWLAMWVDLHEGEEWPLPRRRALIAAAAAIYRMRGTRAGIKQHVGIYTGGLPLVMERTNGFRLDADARLGLNTSIGENRPQTFTVVVAVPRPDELDMDTLRGIIEADKPVETTYVLRVVKLDLPAGALSMRKRR